MIIKEYGVITSNDDEYEEMPNFQYACQIANRIVKENPTMEAFVVIRYSNVEETDYVS